MKYVTFIKIWILGPLLLLLNRLCLLKLWKMGLCYVYSMHDVYSILKSMYWTVSHGLREMFWRFKALRFSQKLGQNLSRVAILGHSRSISLSPNGSEVRPEICAFILPAVRHLDRHPVL